MTGSSEGVIKITDIFNDKLIWSMDTHRSALNSFVYDPNNPDILIAGTEDQFIYFWNLKEFRVVK